MLWNLTQLQLRPFPKLIWQNPRQNLSVRQRFLDLNYRKIRCEKKTFARSALSIQTQTHVCALRTHKERKRDSNTDKSIYQMWKNKSIFSIIVTKNYKVKENKTKQNERKVVAKISFVVKWNPSKVKKKEAIRRDGIRSFFSTPAYILFCKAQITAKHFVRLKKMFGWSTA